MRTARPKRLYSGRWGAWVTGGGVEPDMLVRVLTRYGKTLYCRIKRVLWQGASGAICESIIIAEWDELNLEIPFLDHFRPDSEADSLLLRQSRKLMYDRVGDANGPAPFIEHYEYYQHYEVDCDQYEFLAQGTIEELGQTLLSPAPQTTQIGPGGINDGGIITRGESRVAGENQGSVGKAAPAAHRSKPLRLSFGLGNTIQLDSNEVCKRCGAWLSPGEKGSASGFCGNCLH